MSNISDKDVDDLLDKWSESKQEIAELEKKCDRYKRLADKIMNSKGVLKLSSAYYNLTKRTLSRTTLAKKDVPKDVWIRYARETSYPAYYLTEKKSKK